MEVTHASGYEHPCQFTMDDIELNLSDQDFTKSLADSFEYHKVKVPFEGVSSLQKCEYLGGNYNYKESKDSFEKEDVRY